MRKCWNFLLVVTVFSLVQGCFPTKNKASKKVYKNGDQWIPATFKPQKTVLLIQLLDENVRNDGWRMKFKKWNNEMRTYMQEKYPYKYEFATADEIESKGKKYSDYQKYPFGLLINEGSADFQGVAGGTGPDHTYSKGTYDYFFIDRSSGKKYPGVKKPSTSAVMAFMPVINTLLEGR